MRSLVPLLLLALASLAQASEEALQRFNRLNADPALRAQAYAAGQERIRFCASCHGEDGNSRRPHIPNLAQQNPVYLFNAFEKFASGARRDYVMSRLAPNLTLEDRVNIAVYFGQQPLHPPAGEAVDTALLRAGEVRFKSVCAACHGGHGEGREDIPRLAGQPAEYLRKSLTRFRDKDPSRAGSLMTSIVDGYSDRDIAAVAAYLQGMGE
ncbi:cytochrome c oxidase, cbb3-type, subunit III [compost metagenome]